MILQTVKWDILEDLKNEWLRSLQHKGALYTQIQNSFPNICWFKIFPFINRRLITKFIKMKTGHCLRTNHLYKVNRDEIEDLNHMFLKCRF